MAITLVRIWDRYQAPWGYQVRADFTDGTREMNELLVFKTEPKTEDLDKAMVERAAKLESAALADATKEPPVQEEPPVQDYDLKLEDVLKLCTTYSEAKFEEQEKLRKDSSQLDQILKALGQ